MFWQCFRASRERLGRAWGAFWERLGAFESALTFWERLGAFWERLEGCFFWDSLGILWERLCVFRNVLGAFGSAWERLGTFWSILKCFGSV